MNIREIQKQDTKRHIIDAIRELIKEKSYSSITIREICKQADISIGSYYKYFNSKDDIIFYALQNSVNITEQSFSSYDYGNNGLESLKCYIEFEMKYLFNDNVDWLRESFRLYLYHINDVVLDESGSNFKAINKCIKKGQNDGSIRNDIDSDKLSLMVLKIIIANFFSYCMLEGNFDLEKTMTYEIVNMVKNKKL